MTNLMPSTAFSKNDRVKTPTKPRKAKIRAEDHSHVAFIRSLPCVITGRTDTVEAAHVRYAEASHAKEEAGMGRKPDDWAVVPLCADVHTRARQAQHRRGERIWWEERGIDPLKLAEALYRVSGDETKARMIINAWNMRANPWIG